VDDGVVRDRRVYRVKANLINGRPPPRQQQLIAAEVRGSFGGVDSK
jgi:hypothetical protein